MLIEIHAHVDYPDFANDFDDVLRRATEAGVTRIITIETSVESSRRAGELAEKYPDVFAVIGVHPTYVGDSADDVMTPLRELAKNPRVSRLAKPASITTAAERRGAKAEQVQVFNALGSDEART